MSIEDVAGILVCELKNTIEVTVLSPQRTTQLPPFSILLSIGGNQLYTMIPAHVLKDHGYQPLGKLSVHIGGTPPLHEREYCKIVMQFQDYTGGGTVLFGEEGDPEILGNAHLTGMNLEFRSGGLYHITHRLYRGQVVPYRVQSFETMTDEQARERIVTGKIDPERQKEMFGKVLVE